MIKWGQFRLPKSEPLAGENLTHVRAYGEMLGILWKRAEHGAAVPLRVIDSQSNETGTRCVDHL
jgi:hypothetical protein